MLSDWHMLYFILFWSLVCANFWNKIERCQYKSHWNNSVFWDQWKMMSDLNMSQRRINDFVAFSFSRINLVIKLNYFDFESHRDTLILFYRKKWRQISICPGKHCLIWFKLCFFRSNAAIINHNNNSICN